MHGKLLTRAYRRAQNELDEERKNRRQSLCGMFESLLTDWQCALGRKRPVDHVRAAVFALVSPDTLQGQLLDAEEWRPGRRSDSFVLAMRRFRQLRQFSPEPT